MAHALDSARFWARVRFDLMGCWIWLGGRRSGQRNNPKAYGIWRYAYTKSVSAHRFAWEDTFGPIPEGLKICHRCDNPPCVRPDHLFLGTQKENMADAARKGRLNGRDCPSGEAHPMSKLLIAEVFEIRRRYRTGTTQRALARTYGVSRPTITAIITGRNWRCLEPEKIKSFVGRSAARRRAALAITG